VNTDILHAQHNATSLVVSYTCRSLASGNVCRQFGWSGTINTTLTTV